MKILYLSQIKSGALETMDEPDLRFELFCKNEISNYSLVKQLDGRVKTWGATNPPVNNDNQPFARLKQCFLRIVYE